MSELTHKANGSPWRNNGLWFKSVNLNEFSEFKVKTDKYDSIEHLKYMDPIF